VSLYRLKINVQCYRNKALDKTALLLLPEGSVCAVGAKANVPFVGCHRISKYFVRWGKK
jgi:hypothetical protein